MTMKKILFASVCCLLLAGCGSDGNKQVAKPMAAMADTAMTDTASAAAEPAQAPAPEFLSDDLKAEGLRGQVKKVKWTKTCPEDFMLAYPEEMTFNAAGKNTTKFYDEYEARRNADGIVTGQKLHYGTDGTLASMKSLGLSEKSHPLKASYELEGPGIDQVSGTFAFSDYVYDSHQNWTSRRVRATYKLTDFETDASRNKTDTWTETRTITYF